MKHRKRAKEAKRIVEKYCVTKGEKFRLKDYDPSDTDGVKSKQHAEAILERRVGLLSDMQEKLYAQDRWALLVIFQAMDAAGKDGALSADAVKVLNWIARIHRTYRHCPPTNIPIYRGQAACRIQHPRPSATVLHRPVRI